MATLDPGCRSKLPSVLCRRKSGIALPGSLSYVPPFMGGG